MITLAQVDSPIKIDISRKNTGNAAHTAARALSPIYFQTMIVSAILYTCCIRLPNNIGKANNTSVLVIFHCVKSLFILYDIQLKRKKKLQICSHF